MKILASIIVVALAVIISIFTVSRSENVKPTDIHSSSQQAERITRKSSTPKFPHKPSLPERDQPPLEQLIGHINKEYAIREDILRYIEKELPNNEMAKKAAIKYAQRWNLIYYKATEAEAMKIIKQQFITLKCLRYALKTHEPLLVTDGIDALMRNTPERNKYLWDITTKYFGWKIIGHDHINANDVKIICERGDY